MFCFVHFVFFGGGGDFCFVFCFVLFCDLVNNVFFFFFLFQFFPRCFSIKIIAIVFMWIRFGEYCMLLCYLCHTKCKQGRTSL